MGCLQEVVLSQAPETGGGVGNSSRHGESWGMLGEEPLCEMPSWRDDAPEARHKASDRGTLKVGPGQQHGLGTVKSMGYEGAT